MIEAEQSNMRRPNSQRNNIGRSLAQRRIRSISRLLTSKGDVLTPEEKTSLEERLKELSRSLDQSKKEDRAKAPSEKVIDHKKRLYKRIRFFERKKVAKRLRNCRSQLLKVRSGSSSDDKNSLEKELGEQIEQLQSDFNYINNYPPNKPYIALFVKDSCPTDDHRSDETERSRRKIRKRIERMTHKRRTQQAEKIESCNENSFFISS